MIHQGPIPWFVHHVLDYVAGALLVAAPFLFGFDSSAAKAFCIILGLAFLVVAATTDGPVGIVKSIPPSVHMVLDYAEVALLVAAPFLFSFSNESNPTAFCIVLGIVGLLLTIGTRFPGRDGRPAKRRRADPPPAA